VWGSRWGLAVSRMCGLAVAQHCATPRPRNLATLFLLLAACRGANDSIPTYKVEPGVFTRRVTAEGTLKSTNATSLSAPVDAPGPLKIAWLANDGTAMKKDDVVVRFDATDFEKQLLGGHEDHQTADNKLRKTDTETVTTRTNLTRDARQAERELLAARQFKFDDAEVFSRYQRIESGIDETLAGEKKQHAESVLGVRESLSRADHDLLALEQRKADLKIRNAEQGLHAVEVRAPHDGILVLQRDWRGEIPRIGGTVWAGSPLGEIPDLHSMKAEVFVLEADAAGLAVGKRATIALESNPAVTYPAKITQVDKLARPRMRNVPVQYFGVTLSLERTDWNVMKPGTRVRALLEIDNRANVFTIPRQALFEKQGRKVVYRRQGARFDPVPVEIAASSAGRLVITKGLRKGDQLALRDPTAAEDEKRGAR
jgi:HlyD family secretion protein